MPTTRVVILAAGKGTRMKSDIPKPLISVAGEPMITRLIRSVKESGVDEKPVVVVAPWNQTMFREVLGDSVEYAIQTEQLGTGHAVLSAQGVVGRADRIVTLYADQPFIRPEVIRRLVAMQEENRNAVVMLTVQVPNFEGVFSGFSRWGRILRKENGEVFGSIEAKDASREQSAITEVNPCIYAFPVPWVWGKLQGLKNENAQGEYYLTDMVGAAMEEGVQIVTASADPMNVIGINSPEELAQAEAMIHG